MQALLQLFPAQNFALLGVVLFLPLLGAFVNGIWGKRLGRDGVRVMALSVMVTSFVVALLTFLSLSHEISEAATSTGEHGVGPHVKLVWHAWDWMTTSGRGGVPLPISVRFSVDALSGVMLLVITGVGSLIHLYASSYMYDDPSYHRFFAYLNLFVFSMLVLVLADNLPLLFVGWEGVGLCSYLLIGFWFKKDANASAGKKAFIANRIGDFGLLVAMFLLAYYGGALDWEGIQHNANKLIDPNQIHWWPIGGSQFTKLLSFLNPAAPYTSSAATAIALALTLGATGKSAQIPLYVWLPDAMAGPTPVSALIHAATMVTAGIYLVCRLNFVFVLAPGVMMLVAIIGGLTALLAATIALVQNDLKKVLAYSTVSQLGFMFLGVGMGAFTAGFFHVLTHAFFKACLFLAAGSVIHGMHARIHDDDVAQDMRKMGGLRKHMPLTFATFAAATLAIIGTPLTSGFFSKDEILFKALTSSWKHPFAAEFTARKIPFFQPWPWVGPALYFVGVLAATLTAFYMCRALFLTFFGDFRGWAVGRTRASVPPPAHDAHAHDAHGDDDHDHHHHDDLTQPGPAPHESPRAMTIPLIVLATLAVFGGALNPGGLFAHALHLHELPLDHWLEPVFATSVERGIEINPNAQSIEWLATLGAFLAFACGSGLAYWMYIVKKGEPAKQLALAAPGLHRILLDKWRVDEAYDATVLSGVDALADTATLADRNFVDMILARVSAFVVSVLGTALRALQTGVVHVYSALMVVGLTAIGWFFVVPHPDGQIVDNGNGKYEIVAAAGIGYGYAFYEEGQAPAAADTKYASRNTFPVTLEAGTSKTIELKVRNSFGVLRTKQFTVTRPADAAGKNPIGQSGLPTGDLPSKAN